MSNRQKITVKNPKAAISAYPELEFRDELAQLAAEWGHKEGKFLVECAKAVWDMVRAPEPGVPRIVTMLRTLREHDATMVDQPRKFKSRGATQKLQVLD